MAAEKTLLVARNTFVCEVDAEQHIVRAGESVPSNHPAAHSVPMLLRFGCIP